MWFSDHWFRFSSWWGSSSFDDDWPKAQGYGCAYFVVVAYVMACSVRIIRCMYNVCTSFEKFNIYSLISEAWATKPALFLDPSSFHYDLRDWLLCRAHSINATNIKGTPLPPLSAQIDCCGVTRGKAHPISNAGKRYFNNWKAGSKVWWIIRSSGEI